MPVLKDLVCHVQWAETGSTFPEYGTIYGDGLVETYIAIPGHPQVFTIRLTSHKFISEGLAMVVFIDGRYQCNRNRVNLEPPKNGLPENRSKIDFLLRQKEKPLGDGTYMGREWRFDNTNLVSQLPAGTDQSHFNHLGTIEVLVLRCRTSNSTDRALSTSSSGEHSDIMENPKSSGSIAGADNSDRLSTEKQPEKVRASTVAAEPADALDVFGGMTGGLFDGPADEPSFRHISGDGPSDNYCDYWQQHSRPNPRYGPQEGPPHPPNYRPPPTSFEEARRPRYSYHETSPPNAYARPTSPPPRSERHVHFDYGDGRGPPPPRVDSDTQYNRHPNPPWARSDRPEHTWTRPSYQDRGYYREHGPDTDYHTRPERAHYSYDSGRRTYARHAEPSPTYSSYRPHSPAPSHRPQQAYVPPVFIPPHPEGPPNPVNRPIQYSQGPPHFTASYANVPPVPPIPPKGPIQPMHVPQFQAQPAPHVVPAGMHPNPWAGWPYPGPPGPMYLPPGHGPFYHTQVPNINNGQTGQAGNTSGPDADKTETKGANTVRYDNVSDQNPSAGQNDNGGWGESGGNNDSGNNDSGDGWANSGKPPDAWPNSGGNNNSGGDNSNNHPPDTDWENSKDTNNANNGDGGWGDNNGSGDNNHNTGDNWAGNDTSGDNNNDQSWQNDKGNDQGWNHNDNAGNKSWDQNNQNQNSGVHQQGADASCTNGNKNRNGGGNQQGADGGWANDTNNNQNGNPTPNDQQNAWNGGRNHMSSSSNQQTPSDGRDNSRVLYGPYGPYYGAKSLAQKGPPPDAEEEPRYDVPQAIAQLKGVTKQVQPGPGYLYVKRRCAPTYVDSLDEPYAKFVFKYRTKEQLKNEIGVETAGEPTGDEEVNTLASLDKAELIQMVLRAKGALGGVIPEPSPKVTPPMYGFEQVPVPAPDLSFLQYNLPPLRNVSNQAGLGIRYSNSSGSHRGSGNMALAQNHNSNGSGGWQANNNQQASGGAHNWQDNNHDWNAIAGKNNSGWDGQQERKSSMQSQGSVRHNRIQPQGPSPNDPHDRLLANTQDAGMPGPPPPPPPSIMVVGAGTVGGQTKWDAPLGPGPRPQTPTLPPPREFPDTGGEGGYGTFGDEGEKQAKQPKGGW